MEKSGLMVALVLVACGNTPEPAAPTGTATAPAPANANAAHEPPSSVSPAAPPPSPRALKTSCATAADCAIYNVKSCACVAEYASLKGWPEEENRLQRCVEPVCGGAMKTPVAECNAGKCVLKK